MERLSSSLPALFLALSALACGGGGGGAGGTVALVHEREPNNFPDEADGIGYVDSHDYYAIRGHVDAFDPLDGFAFAADFPVDVEVALHTDNPFAELLVYVYDPLSDTIVFVFDDPGEPLVGSFRVNAGPSDFHLVVAPLHGASGYTLEVTGFPWGSYASSAAGGAAPAGRFTGPASTEDDARRAAADALVAPYLRGNGRGDGPGDAAAEGGEPSSLHARGVLALVDERGEVELLDAVLSGSGVALAARR